MKVEEGGHERGDCVRVRKWRSNAKTGIAFDSQKIVEREGESKVGGEGE